MRKLRSARFVLYDDCIVTPYSIWRICVYRYFRNAYRLYVLSDFDGRLVRKKVSHKYSLRLSMESHKSSLVIISILNNKIEKECFEGEA